jgi:hypothetical protein
VGVSSAHIPGTDQDNTDETGIRPTASNGTTTVIRATATTSWVAYPTTAANDIYEFSLDNDPDNAGSRRIWVSTNNAGTDYTSLSPGDSISLSLKSSIKQIYIRSSASTATFSLWVNRVN